MSDPIRKALAELVAIHYAHATDQACNQAAWAAARAALAEQPSVREPLTDGQIAKICAAITRFGYSHPMSYDHAIARAIERAHGIGVKGEA